MNLPVRVKAKAKRQKAVSFSVSSYVDGHRKVWPRLRVVVSVSNNLIRKILHNCAQHLEFHKIPDEVMLTTNISRHKEGC